MAVYKRGDTYWYKFNFNGKIVRASAKIGNKRVAEQIEAAKKTQLAKREVGLDVVKIKVPTFKDALATEYVTDAVLKSARTTKWEKVKHLKK